MSCPHSLSTIIFAPIYEFACLCTLVYRTLIRIIPFKPVAPYLFQSSWRHYHTSPYSPAVSSQATFPSTTLTISSSSISNLFAALPKTTYFQWKILVLDCTKRKTLNTLRAHHTHLQLCMRTSPNTAMEDPVTPASDFNASRYDAHLDLFAELNDNGFSPPTSRPCTPNFGGIAMDDPFIYTSGFNADTYDAGGDLFSGFNDDGYNIYHDHLFYPSYPSESTKTGSESLNCSGTNCKRKPPYIETLSNTPAPDMRSQTCPEDSCSSSLSTPVSFTLEDCPCQCGGFRESCYLLTLPPSPLHYLIKGSGGAQDQHLFVSDPQQVEDKQKSDLKEAMHELNNQLKRWRGVRSPPRCLRPWSEPATPNLQHDGHTIGGVYIKDLIGESANASVLISSPEAVNHVSVTAFLTVQEQAPGSPTPPSSSDLNIPIKPQEAARTLVSTMSKAVATYPTPEPSSATTPTCQRRLHNSLVSGSSYKRTREGGCEEDDEAQRQLWPKKRC